MILVTGANGGLGHAIVRAFLNESAGNFLWLAVHSRRQNVEAFTKEFADRCSAIDLDVTDSSAWQRAVGEILQKHNASMCW